MDKELQDYKKSMEQIEWTFLIALGLAELAIITYMFVPSITIIYKSCVVLSLIGFAIYYILKRMEKAKNSRLYDLLQEHGYIEIVKETSIVTRQQVENLAELDHYVKMPGICKSAQDILEKHPKLKHITSTNTGIIYPKLHEKYQKIIRKIAQEQTHSNVINSQEGKIKYEYIRTNN